MSVEWKDSFSRGTRNGVSIEHFFLVQEEHVQYCSQISTTTFLEWPSDQIPLQHLQKTSKI